MKCTCVPKLEKKATETFKNSGQFKKPVSKVTMDGVGFAIADSNMELRTFSYLEVELEGQKKLERINLFHTFCPFCGVKQGEEA